MILCTHCAVIQCVIFQFSSLCLLRWRHKGCVEHPRAICFNKMAQFVYTVIAEPGSRTSVWLLLFMIQDAFDLGSAELCLTFLQQKHIMCTHVAKAEACNGWSNFILKWNIIVRINSNSYLKWWFGVKKLYRHQKRSQLDRNVWLTADLSGGHAGSDWTLGTFGPNSSGNQWVSTSCRSPLENHANSRPLFSH